MNGEKYPNVSSTILVLQSASSSMESRLQSLRYLISYINDSKENKLSKPTISKLSQLILDTVLYMIMNDDRTVDIRRRQLIRTECFLILSNILSSQNLYGDVSKKIKELKLSEQYENEAKVTLSNHWINNSDSKSHKDRADGSQITHPSLSAASTNQSSAISVDVTSFSITHSRSSQDPQMRPATTAGSKMSGLTSRTFSASSSSRASKLYSQTVPSDFNATNAQQDRSRPSKVPNNSNAGVISMNIINTAEKCNKRTITHKKYLQSRTSVLYGDQPPSEALVPGADPLDWQRQDRLLGYSKARTWFPMVPQPTKSVLPDERSPVHLDFRPDDLVREYLQMRSMLTYVGDMVMPRRTLSSAIGLRKKDEQSYVNADAYNDAVKEAVNVWTPLVGMHIPHLHRTSQHLRAATATAGEAVTSALGTHHHGVKTLSNSIRETNMHSLFAPSLQSPPLPDLLNTSARNSSAAKPPSPKPPPIAHADMPGQPPPELSRTVLFTKGVLRRLLRKELFCKRQTKETLRSTLEDIVGRESLQSVTVVKHQDRLRSNLQAEHDSVTASALVLQTLMRETIKLQYATLPSRYVCVVEGTRSNSRKVLARVLGIFCRVKARNLLILAWGMLKIRVIEARSAERTPQYAKVAASYLMRTWATKLRIRLKRIWLSRWYIVVSKLIFLQRSSASLRIETVYRYWRDRRKLIALHEIAPYNGPLSDIYLAPHRQGLAFFIPKPIRESRRMFWTAAIAIQKTFRRMRLWKEYRMHRRRIVLIQSMLRMFPKREQYRRLRRIAIKCQAWMRRTIQQLKYTVQRVAAIIVQMYVRRFLSILEKMRRLDAKWSKAEEPIGPAIRIQCKWRINRAHRRVVMVKHRKERRHEAALILQRSWYRFKHAYHTFLLMCCYRVREEEDHTFDHQMVLRGRFFSARKIQREYRLHLFKRVISAVVKVQCWFRGRLGYNLVAVLRKERWAERKLRHWARVKLRFRHNCASRIAFAWLRSKNDRLVRHLQKRAELQDLEEEKAQDGVRYMAAAMIQSVMKGVWGRRWVRQHRAAFVIQKPIKLFLARRRWKRRIKARVLAAATAIVEAAISNAVMLRTRDLVKLHIKMLVQAQKVIRGFLVRNQMSRARQYAFQVGLAVVCVQRFWRDSGAFVKAVQEVLVLRRMRVNPFKNFSRFHHLSNKLFKQTSKLYSIIDPRAGMRISTLLYRIGLLDLQAIFPKKEYRYVSDLRRLDVDDLVSLYQKWKSKRSDRDKVLDNGIMGKSNTGPKTIFRELLQVTSPELPLKTDSEIFAIRSLNALPEAFSTADFHDFFHEAFTKKFGKLYVSRAENLSKMYIDSQWPEYNNFRNFGQVITHTLLTRAMSLCGGPGDVKNMVEGLMTQSYDWTDERQWDESRISECANLLQFAAERAMVILGEGFLHDWVESATIKVAKYKRRFLFRAAVIEARKANLEKLAYKNMSSIDDNASLSKGIGKKSKTSTSSKTRNDDSSVAQNSSVKDPNSSIQSVTTGKSKDSGASTTEMQCLDGYSHIKGLQRREVIYNSLEKPFNGSKADLQFELNLSVCKVYMHLFEELNVACRGISILKKKWLRRLTERRSRQAQLKKFLMEAKTAYVTERHTDYVKLTWNKFRKAETIAHKMTLIHAARSARLQNISYYLSQITAYGWNPMYDEHGNFTHWERVNRQGEVVVQYEMPMYQVKAWDSALKVQRRARKFLNIMRERRRQKAELVARQIEEATRIWAEYVRQGVKFMSVTAVVTEEDLVAKYAAMKQKPDVSFDNVEEAQKLSSSKSVHSFSKSSRGFLQRLSSTGSYYKQSSNGSVDSNTTSSTAIDLGVPYPYYLQFEKCEVKSDMWALYAEAGGISFGTVLVFRVRKNGTVCDVRSTKNEYHRNVSTKRIVHIRLEVGSKVEARFNGEPVFYQGTVTSVHNSSTGLMYTILYDDGEKEYNVPRHFIRSTASGIDAFLAAREQFHEEHLLYEKRRQHFESLKRERLERYSRDLDDRAIDMMDCYKDISSGSAPIGRSIGRLLVTSSHIRFSQYGISLKFKYTRLPLRYPWVRMRIDEGKVVYVNPETNETVTDPPFYRPEEGFYAGKIQSVWHIFRAKKLFRELLYKDSVDQLAARIVDKCQKKAYIGYKLEGATCQQLLRRTGFWDIAKRLDEFATRRQGSWKTLKIDKLATCSSEEYKYVGITEDDEIRRFKKFQEWWQKTPDVTRVEEMSFINYYTDASDKRDLQTCITDSHDLIHERLLKNYHRNASRVTAMCAEVVKSSYPISRLQLEAFIHKYDGKAASAQDNIEELVNKATLSNWKEEREVYEEMRSASRRIGIILANMGLEDMSARVRVAEAQADEIVRTAPKAAHRPLLSGPEAKAALILRKNVLELIIRAQKAALVIQRDGRAFLLRYKYIKLLALRRTRAIQIQSVYRGSRARTQAAYLRQQQYSYWEQLWDDRHDRHYYFNISTKQSSYEEPEMPYRPLVRHLKSAVLIQAWPFLDEDPAYGRVMPSSASGIPPHMLCDICSTRKAVRVCSECQPDKPQGDLASYYTIKKPKAHMTFCFPCFTRRHCLDANKHHQYKEMAETLTRFIPDKSLYLQCCECEELATRKCLGPLDDKQIDELMEKVANVSENEVLEVLQSSRIAGDKKLQMLVAQALTPPSDLQSKPSLSPLSPEKSRKDTVFLSSSATATAIITAPKLSTAQLYSIRALLERMRAECDECYCESCYKDVHSGGKRANHVWRGFQQNCKVCSVCAKSPAEVSCSDCGDSEYCNSCFKVFHGKGRKRKHQNSLITEEISEQQAVCGLCNRRVASEFCSRCGFAGCDSCYECVHKPACDAEEEAAEALKMLSRVCILCGEKADKKCVQCGDMFCSLTWMGNPGCFAKFHNRGNRLFHTTELLPEEKPAAKQRPVRETAAMRKMLGSSKLKQKSKKSAPSTPLVK